MEDKVVKHRNYTFLYLLTFIFCILALIAGTFYFNASMDHTTFIEKGLGFIYKHILTFINRIINIF